MKVKVIKQFLEIPIGTIGIVTTKEGVVLETKDPYARAMWIKFECKDLPVGLCEPFDMHVKEEL